MSVRFLIAEDQRAHQKLLANVVLFLGGESSFASHGQEAIDMAKKEHFDIVLMDLEMPELGGLAAADRLLESWKDISPRPRIVVVSGNNSPESICLCRVVGTDGFIAKPYSTTALRRGLQEVVTRGYCWTDGPSRRMLHLDQFAQTWTADTTAFERAAAAARESLRALGADPAAFEKPEGLEAAASIAQFAQQHGMVKLQAAMQFIQTLPAQGIADASAIMSDRCADELLDLDLVITAAKGVEFEMPAGVV